MKDHVQSFHLTKFDAFGVNRDEVIGLETWFKIHTNVCNVETVTPPKPYKLLHFFLISMILLRMGKHTIFISTSFKW